MPIDTQLKASDTIVIAFLDNGRKLSLPVDDFFESAGLQSCSRVTIYDRRWLKGFKGLPPDFQTFDEMVNHLRELIEQHGFAKVITTGSSGGAHTAMLVAHLLKADHAVVFVPYPYLSEKAYKERNDPAWESWGRTLKPLATLPDELKRYLDLADVLAEWNGKTHYDVHIPRFHEWDYRRGRYLAGLPHVRVISHASERHALPSRLHRQGTLRDCFRFPYRRRRWLTEAYHWLRLMLRFKRD